MKTLTKLYDQAKQLLDEEKDKVLDLLKKMVTDPNLDVNNDDDWIPGN